MDTNAPPLIDDTIQVLSRLPGIGKKSAQRIVFHLLQRDTETATALGELLPKLVSDVQHCSFCRQYTATHTCDICTKRQHSPQICIVESPMDLVAIEQSGAFLGRYFVLHGILSPIDGIGPVELGLDVLDRHLDTGQIQEVIIATNGSIDGETTAHFLRTKLESYGIAISRIAQGVPLGGELEYTDSATLAQALYHRQPWQNKAIIE